MSKTFTVRGVKIRTASQRRFVTIAHSWGGNVRVWDYSAERYEDEYRRPFTEIRKRSNDLGTARKACYAPAHGWCVVIDTVTGEEV
jgi:hypothetical protein